MKTRLAIYSLLSIILIMTVAGETAQSACEDEREICAAGSPWYSANAAIVRLEEKSTAYSYVWVYSIPNFSNVTIDQDSRYQGKANKGKIILVNGRVMLMKGLELEKGHEIDALDDAVLFYQLAISLLTQAYPEGPDKFQNKLDVKHSEKVRGLKIATTSASGFFAAPWTLKGHLRRISTETVQFSLVFKFSGEKKQRTFMLSGEWKKKIPAPSLDQNMSLDGWRAYALGPTTIKQDGATILDYAAQAHPVKLRTLGELRESILKNEQTSSINNEPALQNSK